MSILEEFFNLSLILILILKSFVNMGSVYYLAFVLIDIKHMLLKMKELASLTL